MATPKAHVQVIGGQTGVLARDLHKVLRLLGVHKGQWTVKVVRDAEMAALHARTMGIGGTTDVLTFDMRDLPHRNQKSKIKNQKSLDLDTVICVDEARRRANELGHSVRDELLLYCVHSLLHVQGYDDATPAKARKMHQREDEILAAIGIGPVYAPIKNQKSKIKNPKPRRPS